jgi:hypothetical protein
VNPRAPLHRTTLGVSNWAPPVEPRSTSLTRHEGFLHLVLFHLMAGASHHRRSGDSQADGEVGPVPPPPDTTPRVHSRDNVHGAPPQQRAQGAVAAAATSRTSVQARHRLNFDAAIEPAGALAATQALIRNHPGIGAWSETEVRWRLDLRRFVDVAQIGAGPSR